MKSPSTPKSTARVQAERLNAQINVQAAHQVGDLATSELESLWRTLRDGARALSTLVEHLGEMIEARRASVKTTGRGATR